MTPPHTAPRVIQLIPNAHTGGAEVLALRLGAALRARGWHSSLWVMGSPGPISDRAQALGLPTLHLHRRGRWDLGLIPRLRSALTEHRVDLVHTHLTTALLWCLPASHAGRRTLIHTIHGDEPQPAIRALRDAATLGIDALVACAPCVRDATTSRGSSSTELVTIPNGVSLPREHAACTGAPAQIACVARLADGKGHLDLIDAMRRIARPHRPVLHLIGGGPRRPQIEARIRSLGLQTHVRLHGEVDDPNHTLLHMDLFALPSHAEALPLSALEAGAAGLPLLLTDVGDTSRIVTRGGGWLIPPRRPDLLASAIRALVAMPPPERRAMGGAARERVRAAFCHDRMVDEHERLYERHLGSRTRRR